MTKVLLQGTLDTKEEDCEWLGQVRLSGVSTFR